MTTNGPSCGPSDNSGMGKEPPTNISKKRKSTMCRDKTLSAKKLKTDSIMSMERSRPMAEAQKQHVEGLRSVVALLRKLSSVLSSSIKLYDEDAAGLDVDPDRLYKILRTITAEVTSPEVWSISKIILDHVGSLQSIFHANAGLQSIQFDGIVADSGCGVKKEQESGKGFDVPPRESFNKLPETGSKVDTTSNATLTPEIKQEDTTAASSALPCADSTSTSPRQQVPTYSPVEGGEGYTQIKQEKPNNEDIQMSSRVNDLRHTRPTNSSNQRHLRPGLYDNIKARRFNMLRNRDADLVPNQQFEPRISVVSAVEDVKASIKAEKKADIKDEEAAMSIANRTASASVPASTSASTSAPKSGKVKEAESDSHPETKEKEKKDKKKKIAVAAKAAEEKVAAVAVVTTSDPISEPVPAEPLTTLKDVKPARATKASRAAKVGKATTPPPPPPKAKAKTTKPQTDTVPTVEVSSQKKKGKGKAKAKAKEK